MMPGVVAGFPRKASSPGITLVAAYDGANFGGYVSAYSSSGDLGSISPPGSTAIPGGPPAPGGSGQILAIYYQQDGAARSLSVEVRGIYSSAPFSGVSIDGAAPLTGWVSAGQTATASTFLRSGLTSNPIPAGSHALEFV